MRHSTSDPSAFRLETTHRDGGTVVAVHGALDVTTRLRLQLEVAELRAAGHNSIALDLGPTTFVDASGMAAVVQLTRTGRLTGTQGVIFPGNASVMRTFSLAGLKDRLPFAERSRVPAVSDEPARPRGARVHGAPAIDAGHVAERAGCLIMVLDPDGRIAFFNRRCESVSGWASEQALGRHPWDLFIPPDGVPVYKATYSRLRNSALPDGYDTWWQHRDGERRLVRWTNTSLTDDRDSPIVITGLDTGRREPAHRSRDTAS